MERLALVFFGQEPDSKEEVQKMIYQYPELEGLVKSVNQQIGIDIFYAFDSDQVTNIDKLKCAQILLFLYEYLQYKQLNEIIPIYPYCMAGNEVGEYSVLCNVDTVNIFDVIRMINNNFERLKRFNVKYDNYSWVEPKMECKEWKETILEIKQELNTFKLQNIVYKVCCNWNLQFDTKKDDRIKMAEDWKLILEYFYKQNVTKIVLVGFKSIPEVVFKDNSMVQYWTLQTEIDMKKYKQELYPEKNPKLLVKKMVGTAVCIKNRNEDLKEYEENILPLYKRLLKICENNEKNNTIPTMTEITEGIELLSYIFKFKHSEKLMDNTIQRLLYETGMVEYFPHFKKLKNKR